MGLYSITEAALILRVKRQALKRWVDGYMFTGGRATAHHRPPQADLFGAELHVPDSEQPESVDMRPSEPVIHAELPDICGERVITFAELVELYFVGMFRAHGVPMREIRQSANALAELWGTNHPLAIERFDTDGRLIFGTMKRQGKLPRGFPERFIQILHSKQLVFGDMVRPYFIKLDFEQGEARRYWPIGKRRRVVIDRARSFGKPIDAETGVRTWTLNQAYLGNKSFRAAAWWYDVPEAAVRRAVEYEQYLRAA